VAQPGDDPGAAGLITVHLATASRADAIATVAGRASDELGSADAALSDVANGLARARELAVQLSSAGYTAQQRADGAKEVDGIVASVIANLNTRVGGRYVFGGRADGAPPFDATGNYSGDSGVRQVEIAPGVLQDSSLRADVALKGAGGGVDVLATLQSLSAALSANDPTTAAATLDALASGTAQVASARSQAGVSIAAFDAAVSASTKAKDDATALASKLSDADPIAAASQLAQAQQALDAALTAVAKGFQLSLADKLG